MDYNKFVTPLACRDLMYDYIKFVGVTLKIGVRVLVTHYTNSFIMCNEKRKGGKL
jgi:hypothetical protein